jgi:hypothetical protein
MRALLCSCKQRFTASDDEGLFEVVAAHLSERHPIMTLSEEQVREVGRPLLRIYRSGGCGR